MATKSQRQKERENTLSLLDAAIEAINLAKEISSITPAKAVFGTVSALLMMIKVCFLHSVVGCPGFTRGQESMANELDYVDLGLSYADICRALDRGMNGKQLSDLSQSVRDTINQLAT